MQVLVTAQLTPAARETLERDCAWSLTFDRGALHGPPYGASLRPDLHRYQAAIVEADPIGPEILAAMPALRLLACVRGEPVNIDVEAATQRGIPVLFAPGRNADAVADFTFGLILSVTRWIGHGHFLLRTRQLTEEPAPGAENRADVIWTPRDRARPHPYALYKGRELRNLILGLIGFGDVGRRVAERAVALHMRVLVHDPFLPDERIAAAGCRPVTLDELLGEADVVSLHARGSGRPLLGNAELRRMKAGAYLVNTARAALLDYEALYNVLREGHLAGAGLDVYPIEPLPPDSPLLALDNVTLTPHLAGASTDVVSHQSEIIVANIRALLDGDRERLAIKNPTVLETWYAHDAGQR